MWCFASRPNEILALRFEDIEDKDDQKSVYYYANKKNKEMNLQLHMIFMKELCCIKRWR